MLYNVMVGFHFSFFNAEVRRLFFGFLLASMGLFHIVKFYGVSPGSGLVVSDPFERISSKKYN